jgi:hypothetical protein
MWELRAVTALARLRQDQGRSAEARDLLVPVYGWFTEGFDTPDLEDAKGLLDEPGSTSTSSAASATRLANLRSPRSPRSRKTGVAATTRSRQ